MNGWQITNKYGMFHAGRQFHVSAQGYMCRQFWNVDVQLSHCELDRSFPDTDATDIDFVGYVDQFPSFLGKSAVARNRPEKDMGVEEDAH